MPNYTDKEWYEITRKAEDKELMRRAFPFGPYEVGLWVCFGFFGILLIIGLFAFVPVCQNPCIPL